MSLFISLIWKRYFEVVVRNCSVNKALLKISQKIVWKPLFWSLFFNKVTGLSWRVLLTYDNVMYQGSCCLGDSNLNDLTLFFLRIKWCKMQWRALPWKSFSLICKLCSTSPEKNASIFFKKFLRFTINLE